MADPLTGGCACRAIRFEVTEPLLGAGICHCRRCQRRSGTAAAVNAQPRPGSVRIVEGREHLRSWSPGDGMDKLFCERCGGHLFSRAPGADPDEFAGIRMGAFDGDPGVRPQWRQWLSSAAAWEPVPDDGLPRFDERRVTG